MEEPTPDDDVTVAPLAGFTVGITAARRAEELRTMLERRGAAVLHGPALRLVPLADDVELRAATEDLIARPPHVTLATTGIGFRSWIEAADAWGLGDGLLRVLRSSELIARGPKARGAIRASWLTEAWSPASESTTEVVEHLLARGVAGVRIAVQLHGEPLPSIVEALEAAGAEVVELPVYRWAPPADLAPVDRLTDAVLGGCVDVMAFTSAPAAAGLLRRAATRGVGEALVTALRGPVLALCVGPVTAVRSPPSACRPSGPSAHASARWCACWRRRHRPARRACRWRGACWSCAGRPCSWMARCVRSRPPGWRC